MSTTAWWRRLTVGQIGLLIGQLIAFWAFVLLGDRADSALGAVGDGSIPSLGAIDEYARWNDASGVALVLLGLLFVAGIIRAALKGGWQIILLFVIASPVMFVLLIVIRRLG